MKMISSLIVIVAAAWLAGCASSGRPVAAVSTRNLSVATAPPLPGQPSYASPEEAVDALYKASVAQDMSLMARIVGLPEEDVMTGDKAQDAAQAERFAKGHDERLKIARDPDGGARVFIGNDNYPLASRLVQSGGRWTFDSAGGKEELLSRVVGENELATIGVCRAYVQAQYEYYSEDRNGDDVLQYAQQLASARGHHDGLYWHTEDGEPESPLGELIAQARSEGYLAGSARVLDTPKPYHGYLFRILTAQGEAAPGGAYSYIINGRMVAGFAMVAYPAKYGHSGIMTFVVGANAKVYQRDLGEGTLQAAGAINEYSPGAGWTLVTE